MWHDGWDIESGLWENEYKVGGREVQLWPLESSPGCRGLRIPGVLVWF